MVRTIKQIKDEIYLHKSFSQQFLPDGMSVKHAKAYDS